METVLTLKQGAFHFLTNISLYKEKPQKVDLDKLTDKEVKAIKQHVKTGFIVCDDKDAVLNYKVEDESTPTPQVITTEEAEPEQPEQATPDLPHNTTVVDEEEESKDTDDSEDITNDEDSPDGSYSEWYMRDLKAELKARNIEFKSNDLKEDLVDLLEKDDAKK